MNDVQKLVVSRVNRTPVRGHESPRPGTDISGTSSSGIDIGNPERSKVGDIGRDRRDTRHDGNTHDPGRIETGADIPAIGREAYTSGHVPASGMDSDGIRKGSDGSSDSTGTNREGGGIDGEGNRGPRERIVPGARRIDLPSYATIETPGTKQSVRGRPPGSTNKAKQSDGLVTNETSALLLACGFAAIASIRGPHWQRSEEQCKEPAEHLAKMLNRLPPAQAKVIESIIDPIAFVSGMAILIAPAMAIDAQIANHKRIKVPQNATASNGNSIKPEAREEVIGRHDNGQFYMPDNA